MILRQSFWLAAYMALLLAPLGFLVLGQTPAKNGFWWDFAIGLGFAGLVMMALQFVLTARFRIAVAPFGIDIIYYFHRWAAYLLLAMILAHPVIFVIVNPSLIPRLRPAALSIEILYGIGSAALLVLLVFTSAFRKPFRIDYEVWRSAHLFLAIGAVLLAFLHMKSIGYYSGTHATATLWNVIGFSLALIVLQVRLIRPWRLRRRPYNILEVRPELGDAWTLRLSPPEHERLSFKPGQFAWLSIGHSPLAMREHPFSFASAPRADGELEFTIKALGDFTSEIGQLQPGTRAYVDGPFGAFYYARYPHAPGYVFIAGGIGVTPMLSMLRGLADAGDDRLQCLFTAHSRWDRIPRRDDFTALCDRLDLNWTPVIETPHASWQGETGWITREILDRHLPVNRRAEYEYFICGPKAMSRNVERMLGEVGVPLRRIHTELFDMV